MDFGALCFPAQRAFIQDSAPLVAACCSRRAGKSWGLAYKMIDAAQRHAWSKVLYLTNTRPQAKRIIWSVLQKINADLALHAKFNAVELKMKLPNGSEIELGGMNDEYEIERYRGPGYPLVVIDEAQSIRAFLKYLIVEILRPATRDYSGGQIMLGGTPNAACMGYFRDAVKGVEPGWKVHHWTMRDNPRLPGDSEKWLADQRRLMGWTEESPAYRREYCGEWVRDASSQVYQILPHNLVSRFPEELATDWEFVLGVDLGFVGTTAFVVLAFSVQAGRVVVLESFQRTPSHFGKDELLLTPGMIAEAIDKLRERYDFAHIEVDPGGLGAKFIEELRRRFRIPARAAEKKAKLAAIEMLNGDLRTGAMLIVEPSNADLLHDARMLEWRWDRVDEDARKRGTVSRADLVIDDRTPDHLTDALTYGYRRCRAYLHKPSGKSGPPARGTAAREEWEERAREERELEEEREEAERPWWAREPDDNFSL